MKQLALLGAAIFGTLGAYLPFWFGQTDPFSGWSILGGFIGGLFGIWVGVKVYNAVG